MFEWIRIGRRLEYTMAAFSIAMYLIPGFILAHRAPAAIRWFVWLFWAGFVFPFSFAGLLVGWWMRRRALRPNGSSGSANDRRLTNRLILYVVTAVVVFRTDPIFAKATHWSLSRILFWDFAAFACIAGINEWLIWRKKKTLQ